jgi:hypothetical protein
MSKALSSKAQNFKQKAGLLTRSTSKRLPIIKTVTKDI